MKGIKNKVIIATLFIFFNFLSVIFFWWFYPYRTFKVNSIAMTKGEYTRGESVAYVLDYCKYTAKPATLSRSFEDGIIFRIPPVESNVDTGCHIITSHIEIPSTLPVGEYKIKIHLSYQINPIRAIAVEYETGTFVIIDTPLDDHVEDDRIKFEKLFRDHELLMQEYRSLKNLVK